MVNIRKFVESNLLGKSLKESFSKDIEEKILHIFKMNEVVVKDSYTQHGHFYVETDNTNSFRLGQLLEDLDKLTDSDNIGYESEENDNGFYAKTFEFYDYSEYEESLNEAKDTFKIDKYVLELDFANTETKTISQEYFGVNKDGTLVGDKKDGYGNGGLIKQYKSPSGAYYASNYGYPDIVGKEEGEIVGYIGRVKEVELIPVIIKKKG